MPRIGDSTDVVEFGGSIEGKVASSTDLRQTVGRWSAAYEARSSSRE